MVDCPKDQGGRPQSSARFGENMKVEIVIEPVMGGWSFKVSFDGARTSSIRETKAEAVKRALEIAREHLQGLR
jgi:hypothetical protein